MLHNIYSRDDMNQVIKRVKWNFGTERIAPHYGISSTIKNFVTIYIMSF